MKKIILLFIITVSLIGCANSKRKMLLGKWTYENAEIKITTKEDTSKTNMMSNFVDQINLQLIDLNFKEDGTFETIKQKEIFEKGKFQINNKILTLDYGKVDEIEDFEILAITDSSLKLRNAKNLIIDYKKTKK